MYPLHWACTEGHLRVIIWVCVVGSLVCLLSTTKIPYSLNSVTLLFFLQFLEHGADIDATDKQGCTPLVIAAQYGSAECVIMLVKRGANTEILDMNGDSALHWAVRQAAFGLWLIRRRLWIAALLNHLIFISLPALIA